MCGVRGRAPVSLRECQSFAHQEVASQNWPRVDTTIGLQGKRALSTLASTVCCSPASLLGHLDELTVAGTEHSLPSASAPDRALEGAHTFLCTGLERAHTVPSASGTPGVCVHAFPKGSLRLGQRRSARQRAQAHTCSFAGLSATAAARPPVLHFHPSTTLFEGFGFPTSQHTVTATKCKFCVRRQRMLHPPVLRARCPPHAGIDRGSLRSTGRGCGSASSEHVGGRRSSAAAAAGAGARRRRR